MRRPSQNIDQFDPTPEEISKQERAKPAKAPLCIKCKNGRRVEIQESSRKALSDAFVALFDFLVSKNASQLTRKEVEQCKAAHLHLTRTSKGRYCVHCFDSSLSYAWEVIEAIASSKS
jgi:protein-arginine kinase activator protein McsA